MWEETSRPAFAWSKQNYRKQTVYTSASTVQASILEFGSKKFKTPNTETENQHTIQEKEHVIYSN